jgi:hypothetical protein
VRESSEMDARVSVGEDAIPGYLFQLVLHSCYCFGTMPPMCARYFL